MIATMINGIEETDHQIEASKNSDPMDTSGYLAKLNSAMAFAIEEPMCLNSPDTSSSMPDS